MTIKQKLGSDGSGVIQRDHAKYAQQHCPEGYEVVVAEEDELQLDWDSLDTPPNFFENFCILHTTHGVVDFKRSISKSGEGVHVIIKLKYPLLLETRIAWQAVLGSDLKREALCLVSVSKGELNPVLLYEKEKKDYIHD